MVAQQQQVNRLILQPATRAVTILQTSTLKEEMESIDANGSHLRPMRSTTFPLPQLPSLSKSLYKIISKQIFLTNCFSWARIIRNTHIWVVHSFWVVVDEVTSHDSGICTANMHVTNVCLPTLYHDIIVSSFLLCLLNFVANCWTPFVGVCLSPSFCFYILMRFAYNNIVAVATHEWVFKNGLLNHLILYEEFAVRPQTHAKLIRL